MCVLYVYNITIMYEHGNHRCTMFTALPRGGVINGNIIDMDLTLFAGYLKSHTMVLAKFLDRCTIPMVGKTGDGSIQSTSTCKMSWNGVLSKWLII